MKSRLLIPSYLLAVSLAFRLPFFFVDVINWDESTFILMGQSILDGHLPYTELWDLKPPLAFVPYALFIALLGKSIVAIRLGGTIFIFVTSWLIYLIGEKIWQQRVGIIAGTFFIALSGSIPGGQAVMSEYIALLPLIGGLAVLILNRPNLVILAIAGVLLTVASLIRLNLAYVLLAVGFWQLLTRFKPQMFVLWRVLTYSGGSLLVFALTYLPYAFTQQGDIWLSSVILAPLGYASQKTIWSAFQGQFNFILASISPLQEISNRLPDGFAIPDGLLPVYQLPLELIGISLLVWVGGILGLIDILKQRKSFNPQQKQQLILLAVFSIAIEISIVKSGATFEHYYLQIMPFFALTAGWFWHNLLSKKHYFFVTMAIALLFALSCQPISIQYQFIGDRFKAGESLTYGLGYKIADYLTLANPDREPVYLMSEHIVYWFNDLQPITKSITHPSNIAREYLLEHIPGANPSTEGELTQILAAKPAFIVKPKEVHYFKKKRLSQLLLRETLNTEYQLVKEIQGQEIYKIKFSQR